MSNNIYLQVKAENEKRMNDLFESTVFFAFNNKQFQEGMEKIGAKHTSELYKLGNSGGFYKKTDSDKIRQLFADMAKAEDDALEEYGEEYAYQMFRYELSNHEFGYTMELDNTLDSVGYDIETISKNPVLYNGLKKALERYKVTPEYYGIQKETA